MNKKSMQGTYKEIVIQDTYKMNDFPNNFFDTFIDIGANVGMFSLCASMRHPEAKIFAYEPCHETYKDLLENTSYLDNIKHFNIALGDGSPLFLHNTKSLGNNMFFKESESNLSIEKSPTASCTLKNIFDDNKINGKYFIKIDCEGGERFILNDKESTEIMKNAYAIGMEIHFPPIANNNANYTRFRTFPEWSIWNNWISVNFKETHNILYHHSRKRTGCGVYALKRKI